MDVVVVCEAAEKIRVACRVIVEGQVVAREGEEEVAEVAELRRESASEVFGVDDGVDVVDGSAFEVLEVCEVL